MKAAVYDRYGSPAVLRLADVPTPVPRADEILIRIHAVSLNGSDREGLAGTPAYARIGGIRGILGSDVAGTVVEVGADHIEFKAGDEVFGEIPGYRGGLAEYVCTHGRTMLPKPASLSFEQAAAIPQGGTIALRAMRGRVQPGSRVLINGAGGSAGLFALQLAKLYGADVTGVDAANKLDLLRSLGADHVVDHRQMDFTRSGAQYDLILDLIAHRSVFAYARALKRDGSYYCVGGAVATMLQVLLIGPWLPRKRIRMLVVPQNRADLAAITDLVQAGTIKPVIDRSWPLNETSAAFEHLVTGRARGKVVITVAEPYIL